MKRWPLLTLFFGAAGTAMSQEQVSEDWTFKFTPSVYSHRDAPQATDLNLRGNLGPHALWVGQYRQPGFGEQTRVGYEYTASPDWGQVVYSAQAAERGFAGGSVTAQIGGPVYGIVGWGRTNLQPYYNLNFDPNDAVTWGIGTARGEHRISLTQIRDDRLHTGQRVTHLLWHYRINDFHRMSVDLADKRGRGEVDGPWLRGNSLTLTWDWRGHFVRMAVDQKVNFSEDTQKRVSIGWRF